MKLNFDNLTPKMAVKLLESEELMVEFCGLVKNLNKRVKDLERDNGKLQRFAVLQSHYNKESAKKKVKSASTKKRTKRALPSTPRPKAVQSQDSFGSFGWDDGKDSFGPF